MKAAPVPPSHIPRSLGSLISEYRQQTGQRFLAWMLIAFLNAAVQIAFRRTQAPGEFGTLNSVLAAIALTVVPVLALRQALTFFPAPERYLGRREIFGQARLSLVQNFTLGWAIICLLLFLPALGLLDLPRLWIGLLALANVFVFLGAAICATDYEQRNKIRSWTLLLLLAAVVRLAVAWLLIGPQSWTEAGLAAGLAGGFILLIPLLRQAAFVFAWSKTVAALRDREVPLYLAATLSVMLAIFLFTNADRIIAQARFGQSSDNNMGMVRWGLFDGYQTAGLLGRSLLWGTQPILALLLARRSRQDRSAREDQVLLWTYLGALLAGAIVLGLLAQPLARLFGGRDPGATAYFIPGFVVAMIPLGLLQGIGIFALASRRYPECFTLGVGSLAYTLFLALEGKPQIMLTCMFGGAGVALMAVLFIAVVRWGRAQP